jgi:hypothetical protein
MCLFQLIKDRVQTRTCLKGFIKAKLIRILYLIECREILQTLSFTKEYDWMKRRAIIRTFQFRIKTAEVKTLLFKSVNNRICPKYSVV